MDLRWTTIDSVLVLQKYVLTGSTVDENNDIVLVYEWQTVPTV